MKLKSAITGQPVWNSNKKSNARCGIKFSICQYIVLWGFKIPESRHLCVAPKKNHLWSNSTDVYIILNVYRRQYLFVVLNLFSRLSLRKSNNKIVIITVLKKNNALLVTLYVLAWYSNDSRRDIIIILSLYYWNNTFLESVIIAIWF